MIICVIDSQKKQKIKNLGVNKLLFANYYIISYNPVINSRNARSTT